MMPAPSLVLIAGTERFYALAMEYCARKGWERIAVRLEPGRKRGNFADQFVSSTKPGDSIFVLADKPEHYQGWERSLRTANRKVTVLLGADTMGANIYKLMSLIEQENSLSKPEPKPGSKFLVLLKKHFGRRSGIPTPPVQSSSNSAHRRPGSTDPVRAEEIGQTTPGA